MIVNSREIVDRLREDNILLSIQIEITKRCNQKCGFCYVLCDENNGMSVNKLEELLDEARMLGAMKVIYTGGEPLVRKNFLEILQLTKRKGFVIGLNTNGTLISEENIDEISKYVSEVYISLHSVHESVHDNIVKMKGSYQKVIHAIRILKERNVSVTVNTVVTNVIFEECQELKKFVEDDLGVIWNYDTRIEPTILDDEKAKLHFSLNANKLIEFNSTISSQERTSHNGICRAARKHCFIDADGNVYPCLNFKGASYDKEKWIDNIYEKHFYEIWNENTLFRQIRKYQETDFEKCNECINKDMCKKCMAHNFRETGSCVVPSDERCIYEIIDSIRR